MVPFSSRAGVSVYGIIYGGVEGLWTYSLSEISTTAGTSDDIPGSQPFFGHQGGFTAICCWASVSPCVFMRMYECVRGQGHLPLTPPLVVYSCHSSISPPAYRSSFYVCGCDFDSSCDNSETKVIFKDAVWRCDYKTIQHYCSGLEMSLLITHYMVVCQDLSTVLYGFKTRKGKITTDNTCCSSRQ